MSERKILTTQDGVPVSDNQNSLTAGARGSVLMQDFYLNESIFTTVEIWQNEKLPKAHQQTFQYKDFKSKLDRMIISNPTDSGEIVW